ncbi:MAG TPA: hypothetical protein VIW03_05595, partial [Anaeromyxobacter sp.]
AGRGVEAARAFLDAAELSGTVARAELRRRAAEQLVFAGRVDEGRALAIEGLRDAGFVPPRTPRRALASLLVRRCLLRVRGLSFRERSEAEVPPARLAMLDHLFAINRGLSMADVIRGADLAARYLLLAIATGEQRRFARGLVLEASHAASVAPGSHRVERLLDRLDALDRRFGDPDLHAHVLLVRGIAAYCAGNWKSSFEYCEASERIFRESCTGVVWEIWTMRCFANFALSYLGRWAELSRRVAAHVVEARERGSAYGLVSTGLPFGMTSWLARGEVAAARSLSAEAGAAWCVRGFHLQHLWLLEAGVCLDLYEGRTAVAWRAIQDAWGQLERSMLLRIPVVRAQILHLRAGCALEAALRERTPDARRAALRDAAGAVRRLGRVTAPLAAGLSDLIRAALAAQRGDCEAAARLAARAAEDLDRRQMAGYAAAARRRLASLRGHAPPEPFVTGEPVVDPDAMTRLLAPGFP